ncbi:hypothetical protein [Rhizobium leguminosarum]|uniref:hypothetical protein n=1 Tax=Rhizobium leguminosarum TaxID=384 RepID=UPI002E12C840|nr:hypothetical protein U8Q02_39280 [Rhizobium leguminosarum]
MSLFEPRELDSADKYEGALTEQLGGYGGMIVADCHFGLSSRDEKYFLLVVPREDGPELVGANVAFPNRPDEPYVRVMEIESADVATRKHFNASRYSFTAHQDNDLFVIEALGGRVVEPARVWYQGLAASAGVEHFDVVRINDKGHEEEERRLIVMHSTLAKGEEEHSTEVLLNVGLGEFRSWMQDEFQVSFHGGGPRR